MTVFVLAVGMRFSFELLRPEDWLWPAAGALIFLLCFEGRKSLVIGARRGSVVETSKRTKHPDHFCGGESAARDGR